MTEFPANWSPEQIQQYRELKETKWKASPKVEIKDASERAARQREKDPVGLAVRTMLNVRGAFRGKVSELLTQLEMLGEIGPELKQSHRWPKDATRLARVLRQLVPRLRADGIHVQFNVRISENVKKGVAIWDRDHKDTALRVRKWAGKRGPKVPVTPSSM